MLGPTLTAIGWLRSLVARSGALDYCETGGFTVRACDSRDGDFAVTSGADPRFKPAELTDLAASLREAGYLVELARNDTEPCVLVSAPSQGGRIEP